MIFLYPDERLKTVCTAVGPEEGRQIARFLKRNMDGSKRPAIGLSANQCGYSGRVFVVNASQLKIEGDGVFITPLVIHKSGQVSTSVEGCLSHPEDYVVPIKRPARVTITAVDGEGKAFKMRLFGVAARCVQHEIDHLDGILISDKSGVSVENKEVAYGWKRDSVKPATASTHLPRNTGTGTQTSIERLK